MEVFQIRTSTAGIYWVCYHCIYITIWPVFTYRLLIFKTKLCPRWLSRITFSIMQRACKSMQGFWTLANVSGQEKHSVVSIPFFYKNCLKHSVILWYLCLQFLFLTKAWVLWSREKNMCHFVLIKKKYEILNNQCITQGWLQCIGDRAISNKPFPIARWLH